MVGQELICQLPYEAQDGLGTLASHGPEDGVAQLSWMAISLEPQPCSSLSYHTQYIELAWGLRGSFLS